MSDRQRRARRQRRRRHQLLGAGAGSAAVAAVLISGSVAQAAPASITVDSTSGSPTGVAAKQAVGMESLADAIAYVNANPAGGTITFASALKGDTITLAGSLPQITVPTTITGLGQSELAISGGAAALTMFNSSGSLTLSGLTLENITSTSSAASSVIESTGPLTVSESTLTGVKAPSGGNTVGISAENSVTLSDDTLTNNSTNYGLVDDSGSAESTLTVSNSTISHNTSETDGVLMVGGQTTAAISDSVFSDDSSVVGGAIDARSSVTVTGSEFSGDSAVYGGAIEGNSDLTVVDSTFTANTAFMGGGAIAAFGGAAKLVNSTLEGNVVNGEGDTGPVQPAEGGAVEDLYGASLLAVGDTIDGNSVIADGVGAQGGAISLPLYYGAASTGTVALEDTVVAGNHVTDASAPASAVGADVFLGSGATGSGKFSLIGVGASAADTGVGLSLDGSDQVGTSASPLDPKLAGLADNGGAVMTPAGDLLTQLPESGSPLINTGDAADFTSVTTPFTTDELGAARPFGSAAVCGGDGSDIGAVELQSAVPTASAAACVPATPTPTPTPTPAPTTSTAAPTPATTTPAMTTTPVRSTPTPKPKLDHVTATVGNQRIALTWSPAAVKSTFSFDYAHAPVKHSRKTKLTFRSVSFVFDSARKAIKPRSDRHGVVVLSVTGLKAGTHRLHVHSFFTEPRPHHRSKIVEKTLTITLKVS